MGRCQGLGFCRKNQFLRVIFFDDGIVRVCLARCRP